METLKKVQKWFPRIMSQIAACSDGIRGCDLKKKFFKPYFRYTDQNRSKVQTCLHGDAHAWNMFWNTNLIGKSRKEIDAYVVVVLDRFFFSGFVKFTNTHTQQIHENTGGT